MMSLLSRDNRSEGGKREMNTREAAQDMSQGGSINKSQTYGTRLVWNSFRSTFREPSKRKEAVIEETT
jgi:hypothetical protein